MRLNKYIALCTGLSRREADEAIASGRVTINGSPASLGQQVGKSDAVHLDSALIKQEAPTYVLVNKPIGYVCTRKSQDEKPTVYDLLPNSYAHLKIAGRLDADSRGLLLMTDDGDFIQQLTHPRHGKEKRYLVRLNPQLTSADAMRINEGLELEDGVSRLKVTIEGEVVSVVMSEGRNRQIRRTFEQLGYTVDELFRVALGPYTIDDLEKKVYNTTVKSEGNKQT